MARSAPRFALGLALAVASAALPFAAVAGDGIEHPSYPARIEAHGQAMTLRGVGLLRVRLFFKVYVAGLYVGEGVPTDRVLDDAPKRIEIAYLRDISTDIIIKAGDDSFRRRMPAEEIRKYRPQIDAINKLYVNVKAGDRYRLTYVPGHGCTLALNGRDLGTIEGAEFASAYFGIWLDPRTDFPDFRTALMGLSL